MRTKRQQTGQKTAEFLATHPVFTLSEARAALVPAGKGEAALKRVKYHVRRGRLKAVARGVYATVPPGMNAARYRPDRYLVAASIRPNAIFSHHSALELLGAGHSDWNVCTVQTGRRRVPFEADGVRYLFLLPPPGFRDARRRRMGLRTVERSGRSLLVTGPERTLLDGFHSTTAAASAKQPRCRVVRAEPHVELREAHGAPSCSASRGIDAKGTTEMVSSRGYSFAPG